MAMNYNNSNPFGIQPGSVSSVMPNPTAFIGGTISGRAKDINIYIDAEMLSELWRKYDPTTDTQDPTCSFLQKHFAELNALPRTLNQYPCNNFAPGITEQYVSVEYRLLGRRETRKRNFRFYLDANGNCRCEIVETIPTDYTDRGSGPIGPMGGLGNPTLGGGMMPMSMTGTPNFTMVQPGTMSTVMPNPTAFVGGTISGRAKDMSIYIDAEMLSELWRKYDPTSDTKRPTCAFLQKHFAELNSLPRTLNQYPCKNFPPGITEQYVKVEYRLLGSRETETRNFRFYIDSNGNCRCEMVQTIPPDYTDRGSGPTGGPIDLGQGGMLGGVMGGTGGVEYADSALGEYVQSKNNYVEINTDNPLPSVIDLSSNSTILQMVDKLQKSKSTTTNNQNIRPSSYYGYNNQNLNQLQQYRLDSNNVILGNQQLVSNGMLSEMEKPIYLANRFDSLPSSNLNEMNSISMYQTTPQMGTSLEIKYPTNSFPPINSVSSIQQMTTPTLVSSYLSNTYGGVVGTNYAINQSVNSIGSLPTNTYHI